MRTIHAINSYNEATNPSVMRTDAEHSKQAKRAREAKKRLATFGMKLGVHYFEMSNGALTLTDYRKK